MAVYSGTKNGIIIYIIDLIFDLKIKHIEEYTYCNMKFFSLIGDNIYNLKFYVDCILLPKLE